jgi:heme/copper-type cytochrome/quinol oxidase subunit 1
MSSATTLSHLPALGLQFEAQAEKLMIANAVAAVVFLLIGGILAIGVVLTRWPAVHWLEADTFYQVLTAHGIDMLIFWIIFFEIAVLYFCSSTLLAMPTGHAEHRLAGVRADADRRGRQQRGRLSGRLQRDDDLVRADDGRAGVLPRPDPVRRRRADRLLRVPRHAGRRQARQDLPGLGAAGHLRRDHRLHHRGVHDRFGRDHPDPDLPDVGRRIVKEVDPLVYRTIWWAFGHSSQQINVAAHISIWYAVAAIAFGAKPMSERVSRGAFLLYILFLQLASAHHLLADPGLSTGWKVVNTSYFMYFAVLASMIHGLTIPGAMEVAQRKKGFNKGLFEWLRKAPWGNPVFSGVFISIIGFGFLGGISGVMMGTEQLNMIIHNTIYVPGHFHATVVIGTTLSFMALTYFLIPVLFKREMIAPNLAKWQPYLFGFSMYFFCLVMMGAGTLGVSRRHWDMAFSGSALAYEWPGAAYLMMGLVGITGIAAIVGGAIYIYVTVGSLLWGKKLESGPASTFTPIPVSAPNAAAQSYGSIGFAAPGHLRAGDGVPGRLHPVLLHQLEVPVARSGA